MISEVYTPPISESIERRTFLKLGTFSVTGLVLSLASVNRLVGQEAEEYVETFAPNVHIVIEKSGKVKLIVSRSEMGQGSKSTMAGIIADELEADWQQVEVIQAEGDRKYGDQSTDGSKSVRTFYMSMRRMGATARQMLETAAAQKWGVSVASVSAEQGLVKEKNTQREIGFGDLVETASTLKVPAGAAVKLKKTADFNMIGKKIPSADIEDIVSGKAGYGIDQKIEGMRYAVIARCPVYGGKVKSFDDTEALKIPGVEKTVKLNSPGAPGGFARPLGGIAVVATSTWAAIKGREKLKIEWDEGVNGNYNAVKSQEQMLAGFDDTTNVRINVGDIPTDQTKVEASYFIPHYAHTPMEPPVALADVRADSCEVWAPTQSPQWARGTVAGIVGMSPDKVKLNVTLLGGGFGRKAKPDFVAEAAVVSKACGCPVKLTWTREDDIHHSFYHAQSAQRLRATIDSNNKVTSWNHQSAFPSISGTDNLEAKQMSGAEAGQGFEDFPYDIPNLKMEVGTAEPAGVRIGWLRSVANINHGFGVGSFLDEIAHARKMDPKDNLLDLLGADRTIDFTKRSPQFWNYGEATDSYTCQTGRLRNVIELAAEKSGWGKRLPAGEGMGIAAHRSFLTYVACVVRVKVESDGRVTIPEVHYAVDCGVAVNPERIRAQFEGGAVFGTSLALYTKLSIEKGKVKESNFNDYKLTRMNQSPKDVQVHIVKSEAAPTGVGEPPVPPFAPAICNAIFAATGKRMRRLPVDRV
ncbi:MAG: xanthine dehydrogenase family protein molybdopterin-binding subunit [Roseivirga sp.]|nr:xanthine dehydrogenase family protein molybdopterin-binding subunit [Roseivirga sp.]